ncbi:caspase-12-like isoform X2 [Leopardus geoffroyi]|uniref:caspase-12-like isoform X2 n=1 Tax=Leopardus geoffroyi TaxID=46844 RepID=UPI001E260BC5|nr:caspase-12-like isoform X2 [Leopardus geoffroyi]
MAGNRVNDFIEDLKGKKVLTKQELRALGKRVDLIVDKTEGLIDGLNEKSGIVGKMLVKSIFGPKGELALEILDEIENCDSDNSGSYSSSTEYEDESEESEENEESEEEENAESPQEMDPPTEDTKPAGSCEPSNLTEEILDENEKDESGKIKSFSSSTVFQVTQASQINVLKLCPCIHFKEPKTIMAHEIYPVMEKKSRMRLALIICNRTFDYLSEREGCEKDISGMRDLLENLGYSVVIKENLTAQEMKVELKHFATRPEHRFSDSTFLVFMSHGILDGICGTKHREEEPDVLHDDTIFQIFNNRNCRNLKDKPKVIIMQACRGKGNGAVWVTDVGEACAWPENQPSAPYIFSDAVQKTHVEKDFIAFKSSTPHNVSWRLNTDGSVFISHLIRYFKMYSCCHHLEEIFRKVQYSFETPNIITQMPTIERLSMTRYFYLFPGN